jgi:hypothetical protein
MARIKDFVRGRTNKNQYAMEKILSSQACGFIPSFSLNKGLG